MFTIIDSNNEIWSIPLVDFHSHIGKVSIETTKGRSQRINRPQDILDLYQKMKFELYDRISSNKENYSINLPSKDDFVTPMHPIVKNSFLTGHSRPQGWIVDHIVTFPFNDIFHLNTIPKFVKSNEYVRKQIQKPEFTFRFIPFCRVDATDDLASQEIKRSRELGMRGLKLHPLSQNWIEKIVTDETKLVLKTAGKLGLPIIFDVPNKGVAKDITTISIEAREEVDFPIHVVLGHNGFDYSSSEIFEYVSKNQMFTEISGLRGSDVKLFFKNVIKIDNWYDKIVFGSDANYFSVLQAVDFISFLFTHEFDDLLALDEDSKELKFEIISKILALNALNIIPNNIASIQEAQYQIKPKEFIVQLKDFLKNKTNFVSINLVNDPILNESKEILNFQLKDEIFTFELSIMNNDPNLFLKSNSVVNLDPIQYSQLIKFLKETSKIEQNSSHKAISNLEDVFKEK